MVGTQLVYFEAVTLSSSNFMGSHAFCVTKSRHGKGNEGSASIWADTFSLEETDH